MEPGPFAVRIMKGGVVTRTSGDFTRPGHLAIRQVRHHVGWRLLEDHRLESRRDVLAIAVHNLGNDTGDFRRRVVS